MKYYQIQSYLLLIQMKVKAKRITKTGEAQKKRLKKQSLIPTIKQPLVKSATLKKKQNEHR